MGVLTSLFEMRDFAPPKPEHAEGCVYCRPDDDGIYPPLEQHTEHHLPRTCEICGRSEPNSLLFEMNHHTLGRRPLRRPVACTALWLTLNHLTYDVRHGTRPAERDLWPLDLGWRIGPDGAQIAPADWDERFAA